MFLDLAKAFDTVSHRQLLEVLQDIGFRGNAFDLMSSYLKNREQYVIINTKISEKTTVEYGVPQGTVLGPILFIIYINSLLNLRTVGTISSFADDTVIFYSASSWGELKQKVEQDINIIIDYFNSKTLTINFKKTYFLPFSCYSNNLPTYTSLNINNHGNIIEIQTADQVKYLGITFDRHMRWDMHILNIIKTLRSILYKYKYLNKILDVSEMKVIYYALIETRLTYGIIGWGGAAKCHQKKLDVLQKKFLKIMLNKNNTYPSDLLFSEAKILDLRQIYFHKIVIDQFKNKNKLSYIDHKYFTRNKSNDIAKTILSSKTIGQRGYHHVSTRLYNSLPKHIKDISNMSLFKKQTKMYIFTIERNAMHKLIEP